MPSGPSTYAPPLTLHIHIVLSLSLPLNRQIFLIQRPGSKARGSIRCVHDWSGVRTSLPPPRSPPPTASPPSPSPWVSLFLPPLSRPPPTPKSPPPILTVRYSASNGQDPRHEAAYDAFMTGVVFAQACHRLGLSPHRLSSLPPAASAAAAAAREEAGRWREERRGRRGEGEGEGDGVGRGEFGREGEGRRWVVERWRRGEGAVSGGRIGTDREHSEESSDGSAVVAETPTRLRFLLRGALGRNTPLELEPVDSGAALVRFGSGKQRDVENLGKVMESLGRALLGGAGNGRGGGGGGGGGGSGGGGGGGRMGAGGERLGEREVVARDMVSLGIRAAPFSAFVTLCESTVPFLSASEGADVLRLEEYLVSATQRSPTSAPAAKTSRPSRKEGQGAREVKMAVGDSAICAKVLGLTPVKSVPTVAAKESATLFNGLKATKTNKSAAKQKLKGTARAAPVPASRPSTAVRAAIAEDINTDFEVADMTMPQGGSWSVHKFGGTCVGSAERILNVARIVASDPAERRFVVVSAMGGTPKVTNILYSLLDKAAAKDSSGWAELIAQLREKHRAAAAELLGEEDEETKKILERIDEDLINLKAMLKAISIAGTSTEIFTDFIVGHGELWSAMILTATLQKVTGKKVAFMDARDVLVVHPAEGGNQVDPNYERCEENLHAWYAARGDDGHYEGGGPDLVVATGFIARTEDGVPTTLKRDGSDLSAAIFGSLLRAGRVIIWTDVDGVYSADPRKVPDAVILKNLSYQEAWELSYFGANVLHPRTTLPVMKYAIPMFIRNAFNPTAPGTRIGRSHDAFSDEEHEAAHNELLEEGTDPLDAVVKGFATIENVALVNVAGTGMAGVPGIASQIFNSVKNVGANVIAISQASSEHSVCFAVPEPEADMVAAALRTTFRRAIESNRVHDIEVIPHCTVLAAVGQRMASTPGVSAALFAALAKARVNVRAIAQGCSEYNITVVVDRSDAVAALRAAHGRFYHSQIPLAVALIGPGLIGGTLLDQIRDQRASLKKEFNIDMRVVGIIGANRMLIDNRGVHLSNWREELESRGEAADMVAFEASLMDGHHGLPNTVVVDCTASSEVADKYPTWLAEGLHVVTPNKKANSGPLKEYLKIRQLQRELCTHYLYEATVGAGLPIVATLKGLLDTGDHIHRIEGIFSGTLSYIFNSFDGSKPFSQIVAEARANGFTEPDPRDDLEGMDVARKVVILARECGLRLELDQVPIQSLVPEALQHVGSVDEFMQRLPEFDDEMEAKRKAAEEMGEVLRYVGVVDMDKREGRVELRQYPRTHAFTQLVGSDNIISFVTYRYNVQPLIVRGPGAGAEVTAGGVFSDLLRLAAFLGAPS
ncbi:unnamed protein product [Closterium sp. NIES-65]|nr:unnamed protein product [Closterium sp. NIES-65]